DFMSQNQTTSVSIKVFGRRPIPWGNNEWEWRSALAEKARALKPQFQLPALPTKLVYAVEITFFFTISGFPWADLDNLAKPVLDTLFRTYNPQVKDLTLTGALVDADDSYVTRLVLEKRQVQSPAEEGAEIQVICVTPLPQ